MTLIDRIEKARDTGDEVALAIPLFGFVSAKIESVDDDVVVVAMSDGVRAAMHFTSVVFLLPK